MELPSIKCFDGAYFLLFWVISKNHSKNYNIIGTTSVSVGKKCILDCTHGDLTIVQRLKTVYYIVLYYYII